MTCIMTPNITVSWKISRSFDVFALEDQKYHNPKNVEKLDSEWLHVHELIEVGPPPPQIGTNPKAKYQTWLEPCPKWEGFLRRMDPSYAAVYEVWIENIFQQSEN